MWKRTKRRRAHFFSLPLSLSPSICVCGPGQRGHPFSVPLQLLFNPFHLLKLNRPILEGTMRKRVCLSKRPSWGRCILILVYRGLLFQEGQTQMTTPTSFRRFRHRRREAVHVVTSITVITEQQLVIIFWCSTHVTALAFNALPSIGFHSSHHHWSELQTRGVTRTATVWAGYKLFWLAGFLVQVGISQTKITVVVWQSQTVWALLRSLGFILLGWSWFANVHLIFLLPLLLSQVRMGVMITETRPILIALPTDYTHTHTEHSDGL